MQAPKKSLVRASLAPTQALRFQIEIDNMADFRQQLDSVKFPVKDAAKKYFDVVLCVTGMGVTLAS
jgi:adenine/guanine phosphoribosyltransferase-like PRPP-binding protein